MSGINKEKEKIAFMEELTKALYSAFKNLMVFSLDHPLVQETLERFNQKVQDWFGANEELIIGCVGKDVIIENVMVDQIFPPISYLHGRFKELKIEKVTLCKGLKKEEIGRFLDLLAENGEIEDFEHIRIGALEEEGTVSFVTAKRFYKGIIDRLKVAFSEAASQGTLPTEQLQRIICEIIPRMQSDSSPFLAMVNLRTHDDYTFTHATNVAVLTMAMAQRLGIADSEIHELVLGSLFHDIGKLMIPREVLNKLGGLTAQEMELIQRHPLDGARFLLSVPNISEIGLIVTFEHHMKLDGSGYPKLGGGNRPHLYAQMVAIADIYDALRTDRPYREALSPEKTASIMMKMAEREISPHLTRHFFHVMGIYPLASMVRLDTGEIGIVKRQNPSEPLRPLVRIMFDKKGSPISSPWSIDLGEKGRGRDQFARVIKESLGISSAELFQCSENS